LLAATGALLLVMLLIGGAVAVILALQKEPFSWEGPVSQEAALEQAMHFDASGRLTFIDTPASLMQSYDALSKDMAFQVLDDSGGEVLASAPGPALDALRSVPVHASSHMTRTYVGSLPLQVQTTPIERGARIYLLRDARSERLALGIRSGGSAIFYGAAGITALLAVVVFSSIVFLMARRAVRPLKEASCAAAAIEPGNLTQRVNGANLPSELSPLIDAFNGALERLEKGYRMQQEFLASAAHELKTPLALMRAEIELGNVANPAALLKDVEFMTQQVNQLLQLAEVSEIQNLKFSRTDIRAVLEAVVTDCARVADPRGIHLRLVADGTPGWLQADGDALATLLRNLIENAIHHSLDGGIATIRLASAGITVRDVGPGVTQKDVATLFTRFWRSDSAPHEGAGLGLSICRTIATAHRWSLTYRPPTDGPGAEFHLAFETAARSTH